jgi:hypothetical protein
LNFHVLRRCAESRRAGAAATSFLEVLGICHTAEKVSQSPEVKFLPMILRAGALAAFRLS